jgi:hypothetical protein
MAKRVNKPINTGTIDPHTFDKDLVEDISGKGLAPNVWTQARNAVPNTVKGDLGELSNEQANKFCAAAPYLINGLIFIDEDRWAIFSTDETDSEIGLFTESLCTYETIVNDQCLNFSKLHLIKGVAKERFDCGWQLYWDDGNEVSRTLNIDDVPWIENCTTDQAGCVTCVPTTQLDCDKIRLAPLVTNPCFRLEKGVQGGELLNGSYFVVGAYILNGQKITDYSVPSNVQALFAHSGQAGSLEVFVEEMDPDFDEFELVLVEIRNLKTLAKRIGTYSTRQQRISIDIVDDRYETIPIGEIPLRNPIIDKSDAIFRNGDYMIRTGPTDKFDFNYQPMANQITSQWVAVEYDADYYRKGGNKTNYLRDEVYSFFIRWVYDTGDKSASYHIPGRVATGLDTGALPGEAFPDENAANPPLNERWRIGNTATQTSPPGPGTLLADGGRRIASGPMAYWESSELYDDDTPQIWNATFDPAFSGSTNPDYDLCGKPIRHHKFPTNTSGNFNGGTWDTNHYNSGGTKIRLMAIEFANIKPPLDNDNNPITNIVGYEILRGTREGNKSITAKGMINNMRKYTLPNASGRVGLYPNYPYNPQNYNDEFIGYDSGNISTQLGVSETHQTFHSPDTSFKDPFLNQSELRMYGEMYGLTEGQFEFPDGHPKHQLITNMAFFVGMIGGIGYALLKKNGQHTTNHTESGALNLGLSGIGGLLGGYGTGYTYAAAPALYPPGSALVSVGIPEPAVTTAGLLGATNIAGTAALWGVKQGGGGIIASIGGLGNVAKDVSSEGFGIAGTSAGLTGLSGSKNENGSIGGTDTQMPAVLTILQLGLSFAMDVSEGFETILRLIRALTDHQQYALQYQSHCFYNAFPTAERAGQTRRQIGESLYLDPDLQDIGINHRINNLYRSRTVALELLVNLLMPFGTDDSQRRVGNSHNNYENPTVDNVSSNATSFYAGLKTRLRNQYGQIEGIIQIPATTCMTPIAQTSTDVIFGGDTYVGRYTEKNTMFFFYNWLRGQPDGEELDYEDYVMIPEPRYWVNTVPFDFNEFFNSLIDGLFSSFQLPPNMPSLFTPGDKQLDRGID